MDDRFDTALWVRRTPAETAARVRELRDGAVPTTVWGLLGRIWLDPRDGTLLATFAARISGADLLAPQLITRLRDIAWEVGQEVGGPAAPPALVAQLSPQSPDLALLLRAAMAWAAEDYGELQELCDHGREAAPAFMGWERAMSAAEGALRERYGG